MRSPPPWPSRRSASRLRSGCRSRTSCTYRRRSYSAALSSAGAGRKTYDKSSVVKGCQILVWCMLSVGMYMYVLTYLLLTYTDVYIHILLSTMDVCMCKNSEKTTHSTCTYVCMCGSSGRTKRNIQYLPFRAGGVAVQGECEQDYGGHRTH